MDVAPRRRRRPSQELPASLALLAVAAAAHAAPPPEVESLAWCAGGRDCLEWSAAPGATSYALYRGDGASLALLATAGDDSCRVGTFAAATSGRLLPAKPPSGGLEWYLVVARNGDGDGPSGSGSSGPRDQSISGDCCDQLLFLDDFAGSDGGAWHAPWTVLADSAAVADLQAGEGRWQPRLSGVGYSLARMAAPVGADGERDIEVSCTIRFEEAASQGIGLYVRQNGGYCTADNTAACAPAPAGRGYALFLHGPFLGAYGMEFWKEEGGDEIQLASPTPLALSDGVRYRVRFRVVQSSPATTSLAAKVWPEADAEPDEWQATLDDPTPSLQGDAARGGIGVDSFYLQSGSCGDAPSGHTFLDDVEVVRVCNQVAGASSRRLLIFPTAW